MYFHIGMIEPWCLQKYQEKSPDPSLSKEIISNYQGAGVAVERRGVFSPLRELASCLKLEYSYSCHVIRCL